VIEVQRNKVVAKFINMSIFTAVKTLGYRTKISTYTGYINDEKYESVGGICR
jgi:hypothetical protein